MQRCHLGLQLQPLSSALELDDADYMETFTSSRWNKEQ